MLNEMTFFHPEIADLAWVIGSAPLMLPTNDERFPNPAFFDSLLAEYADRLRYLDAQPHPPSQLLNIPPQEPLGKRFERYVKFWLTDAASWNLLANNIQVVDAKGAGEFDFLCANGADVVHLEVACKFYISRSNSSDHHSWIGPNGTDSLAEKMRKLEKQLTLSQTEHGKDALARLGIHNPTTQAWMKGYFFHHFKDLMQARAPLKANPHYNAGWWCFEHECSQIVHETGTYLIAAKKHWLSSQFRADQHEVLSGMHAVKTIQLHVQKTRKSVAVIQVLPEAGVYREINRGFVLPNTLSDQAIV